MHPVRVPSDSPQKDPVFCGISGQMERNRKVASGGAGHDVKDNPKVNPGEAGKNPDGPMKGFLMNWTQMLESLDEVSDGIECAAGSTLENTPIDNVPSSNIGMSMGVNEDELLNELNMIFTPILVMQGVEGDIAEKVNEACSEDNVLLERNIIKFDDATRMAQLTSVCALLIARQKNSQQYQMYKKAAEIRNSMKLEIQKQEYAAAQSLAQKFLVKVSTTNNSSVARQSAQNLLPATQH